MGNRSHSKIDQLPLELRDIINKAIVKKGMTYAEITRVINQEIDKKGLDSSLKPSQSSVERYGKKFMEKLERIETAREQAKTIIDTSAGLKTDMAEATSTVAFQMLFDMLINNQAEDGQLDKNALKAIDTLAKLERSAVSREKLKFEFDKGVTAAVEQITEGVQKELENYPDIQRKMLEIVKKTEGDLNAK